MLAQLQFKGSSPKGSRDPRNSERLPPEIVGVKYDRAASQLAHEVFGHEAEGYTDVEITPGSSLRRQHLERASQR